MTSSLRGPHTQSPIADARGQLAARLFDRLWDRYRQRVSYVATYEQVVQQAGATFVNDHIAFRTLASSEHGTGIASLSRIFEALGYTPAGCYAFPEKRLHAVHFQHPEATLPKLFISELKTWEFSDAARTVFDRSLSRHRTRLSDDILVAACNAERCDEKEANQLLDALAAEVEQRPWPAPSRADVEAANAESQYAAWVLVHGYEVNHFTSLINSHGVPELGDIERTAAALAEAGVPIKESIEGEAGSKLRQTATLAVMIDVDMEEDGRTVTAPWTYAYFELAERGDVVDQDTGRSSRFEGFLGPQATQLFDMTRVEDR